MSHPSMTDDDARHGTQAGYSAHRRAGQTPCADCRAARSRTRTDVTRVDRLLVKPQTKRERPNCAIAGYSPNDGLVGGEWVVRPNSAGVLDWRPVGGGSNAA